MVQIRKNNIKTRFIRALAHSSRRKLPYGSFSTPGTSLIYYCDTAGKCDEILIQNITQKFIKTGKRNLKICNTWKSNCKHINLIYFI
jgi:hypothetical protein